VVFGASCAKPGVAVSNRAVKTAVSVTTSARKHLSTGLSVPFIRGPTISSWQCSCSYALSLASAAVSNRTPDNVVQG
jgi:hypothetical protein